MKNKKGFTLVELVIVIAVIAILAGVMIGTFASVVKKAKESAKMQEMTAQKQEQIANDIDQKLKDASWLGWTDFEEKLADAMAKNLNGIKADVDKDAIATSVKTAVEEAFAKYASSIGTGSTGLTAEQVKYIVETALSNKSYSGVTAEQVKAIVNNATSGLSNLSKAQVQAIVDTAQAKNLTLAQVSAAIAEATKNVATKDDIVTDAQISAALTTALKDYKAATLTEAEIEKLLQKYVSGGKVQGDYSWYVSTLSDLTISGKDNKTVVNQLVALSTMAKGGTSFAGKTITIANDVDLSAEGVDFQPIMDFDGTLKGATKTENNKTVPATTVKVNVTPVWNTLDGRNGKTMMNFLRVKDDVRKDAVGYGFVASLLDGGVIENINVVLEVNAKDPGNKYTYFGGIVGFLDGGIIRNCKVTGTIDAYGRIGGVVGYAKSGTISGVDVSGLKIISHMAANSGAVQTYSNIGGIAGYVSAGKLEVTGCTLGTVGNYTVTDSKASDANPGLLFGVIDKWKKEAADGGEWGNGAGEETVISITDCGIADGVDMNTLYGWHGDNITFNLNGKKVTLPDNG